MTSRTFVSVTFAALLCGPAFAQTAAAVFDTADVHLSPRATWAKVPVNNMQGGILNAGRYELHRATMLDLIKTAYNVDADKIYGGPSWLDYDKFEIIAKTRPGTRPEALRRMLQSLLEERFKLSVKMDTKTMPAYVLSVAKDQSKLRSAAATTGSGCRSLPTVREAVPMGALQCRGVTMEAFASELRTLSGAYFESLPVVDATALDGTWDIDLKYPALVTRISPTGTSRENADGIFDALEKQLGLKLELGMAPREVLSVVSLQEQLSPNPPGVEAALPPLPAPEFEVVSVRPCEDAQRPAPPRFEPGGRVTATCWPLRALLSQVLHLNGTEPPPGLPKWLDSDTPATRISIVAKAPDGAFPDTADTTLARDNLDAMLRALLVDRYKLATHFEDRPADAFNLVAVKPKLTKADPAGRTGCARQYQPDSSVKVVCRNVTMAQFAEQILAFYPEARYPIQDSTRLEGAWDFTLEYQPFVNASALFAGLRARAAGDAPAPTTEAAEPVGPASIVDAMEKQLGLKLEMHKRPESVLVIDYMEEKPTEN